MKFQGTRDESHPKRQYKWKSFKQVYDIAENLARGCMALDLVPELPAEDDIMWRFMGIFMRTREEWLQMKLANMFNSVKTVGF